MGPGIGILLFFFALLVVLLVGSTLYRAAVALANAAIGPTKPNASLVWDWEAAEDDDELAALNRKLKAIPEPGLGQGMGIVFVAGLIHLVVNVMLAFLFDLDGDDMFDFDKAGPMFFAHLLSLAVGFTVMTSMGSSMLPTTGKRAALASLFFYLISIVVIGLIVGVIFFVFASMPR